MQDKKMLDILFVTDFVCPYCLVAKEALNQALKEGGVKAKSGFILWSLRKNRKSGLIPTTIKTGRNGIRFLKSLPRN